MLAMQHGSTGGEKYDEQIRRATRHCIRARLDALKAIVLFYVTHQYNFHNDYRLVILPDNNRKKLNDYREKIQKVLSQLSKDNADSTNSECDQLRKYIDELRGYYNDLENSRELFNQLLLADEVRRQKEEIINLNRSSWIQHNTNVVVGVVGIIIGVVLPLLGKLFWK
ncbi:MAG: hypothetical protein ACRCUY_12985 [Thermoguttaceae bacterium]